MAFCLVKHNADEPCTQPRVGSKSAQIQKGFQECLLNDVFRIGLIPNHRERHATEPVFMGTDQVIEEVGLPGNDKRDKSDFIAYCGRFNAHACFHSDSWTAVSREVTLRQFK